MELWAAMVVWWRRFHRDLHGCHCLRSPNGWITLVAACLSQGWWCSAFDPAVGDRVPLPSNCNTSRLWAPGSLLQRPTGLAPRRSAVLLDVLAGLSSAPTPGGFPAAYWCPKLRQYGGCCVLIGFGMVLCGCSRSRGRHLFCSRVSASQVRWFDAFRFKVRGKGPSVAREEEDVWISPSWVSAQFKPKLSFSRSSSCLLVATLGTSFDWSSASASNGLCFIFLSCFCAVLSCKLPRVFPCIVGPMWCVVCL